ncbi:MAG: cation diffusion facilitator family transporter [Phycisphaerae bacterium]
MDGRASQGLRTSTISMALNGGLGLVKLVTGIVGQSYALIADAIESLGDIFSSVIVCGGIVIASRPADEDHPYGHGKAEPLAALAVATMLIGAATAISIQAVHEIVQPHGVPAGYTLPVLLAVVTVKELMYRYEVRIARHIDSVAVAVDAWHHRSDALTSTAAAIGITIALVGGEPWAMADDWAALAACLVIFVNGVRFARTAIAELMDTAPRTAFIDNVHEAASVVKGARFVEKVLVRKMGPSLYVDLHLEVDPSMSVHDAHGIAHAVKDSILRSQPEVADVLVHIEPHNRDTSQDEARPTTTSGDVSRSQ